MFQVWTETVPPSTFPEVVFDYFITISKEYMNNSCWMEKRKVELTYITFYITICVLLHKPMVSHLPCETVSWHLYGLVQLGGVQYAACESIRVSF